MEINGTNNSGAATYALKKAVESSGAVLDVVKNSAGNAEQTTAMQTPEAKPVDLSAVTGKGKIVDIMV